MVEFDENTPAHIPHRWATAFMSGESTAVAALYTDDGVWEDRATAIVKGRANIADHLAIGLSYATYHEMEPLLIVVGHEVVVAEWIWRGTSSTHARENSDQTPFSTRGIAVFEMESGLIARSILYYDYDDLFN